MSPKSLPPRPSLEQYRKQAKDLRRSYRTAAPAARQRVREYHPGARELEADPAAFSLADAQWVIAREHGFDRWPKFVHHIRDLARQSAAHRELAPQLTSQLKISTAEVYSARFSEDGSRVLVGAEGVPVSLWDTASGECLRILEPASRQAYALSWKEHSQHALVGESDGTIGLWHVETSDRPKRLVGHEGEVRSVDLSPDLKRGVSGCSRRDLSIRIWDLEDGRCRQLLDGHSDGIYTVVFDSNLDRVLSGSRDTTLRLWDASTGSCLLVMRGHKYHVHCVAWSPNELTAASCSGSIRLWDLQTGSCLLVLDGHTDTIRSVSWSRDGRRLLSASHDGTARLWDASSRECLAIMQHPIGLVNAAFAMHEEDVITADWLGNVCTWEVT